MSCAGASFRASTYDTLATHAYTSHFRRRIARAKPTCFRRRGVARARDSGRRGVARARDIACELEGGLAMGDTAALRIERAGRDGRLSLIHI